MCQRFEELTDESGFDAVIGSSVLHHLDVSASLRNIRRLLKPGGWMSFAEPNLLNPQVFLERHPGPFHRLFYYISPDETAFVRWSLTRVLSRHGFESIRITPFDWLHPATPRPLIGIVRTVGSVLESVPGVREFAGSLHISARRPTS